VPLLIAPLFFMATSILVVAGVEKARRPRPTTQALYTAGLPGSDAGVRALGAAEIVIGAAALIRPAPWSAVAVATLYLLFAGVVTFLLVARPGAASCGCAGSKETPPSWLHVGMNLAASCIGVAAAVVGVPSLVNTISTLGLAALPAAIGLVTAGWLVSVVVAEVPRATRAWTPPTHHEAAAFDPDRHRRADVALTTAGVATGHPSLWPDHDPATGARLEDVDVGH
jgi:hypothetical protein